MILFIGGGIWGWCLGVGCGGGTWGWYVGASVVVALSQTDVVDVDGRDFEGTVSVEFETREGSARIGKDFEYTQGLLVCRTLSTHKAYWYVGL